MAVAAALLCSLAAPPRAEGIKVDVELCLAADGSGSIAEDDRLAYLGVDDIVLVDLAEILEDELGERTIGFHIDDEDLQELETVRDAIDDVVSRLA